MAAFQLPDAVLGDAAGVITYSCVCLIGNMLLVWLVWTSNDRLSYIACIGYFTLIATYSSIIQQLWDFIYWKDLMTEQFRYSKEHWDDAEVQYQKGAMGLKLVLSYIRIFAYAVESTFVFFFSLSLASTVYGWFAKKANALRTISISGRIVPVVLGLLTIILLQFDAIHRSFIVYMVVANAQFILSLVGSCLLLITILFKYIQTRRQLKSWDPILYGKSAAEGTSTTLTGGTGTGKSRSRSRAAGGGTFDNWLVIRLTIALLALCVFEYTNIAPRISAKNRVVGAVTKSEPDLSAKKALSSIRGYLSGVTPSAVAFIVFGTTKAFQRKMKDTFIPKRFRKKKDDDDVWMCRNAVNLTYASAGGSRPRSTMASTMMLAPSTPISQPQTAASSGDVGIPMNDMEYTPKQYKSSPSPISPLPLSRFNPSRGNASVTTRVWSG